MGPVSSELKARLESYQGYLKVQDTPGAEDKDLASSLKSSNSMRSLVTKEENVPGKKSMDLLEVVAQLFGMPTEVCRQKVEDLKETCTRQAVLDDLKVSELRYVGYHYSDADVNATCFRSASNDSIRKIPTHINLMTLTMILPVGRHGRPTSFPLCHRPCSK